MFGRTIKLIFARCKYGFLEEKFSGVDIRALFQNSGIFQWYIVSIVLSVVFSKLLVGKNVLE